MTAQISPAFELENVTVRFRTTTALDGATLRIAKGEAVAFVGPSGAGKTTLLRLFNGSVRPAAGHVKVGDRPLARMEASELRTVRASLAFIHQDLRLVPNLRVLQNVVAGRLGTLSPLESIRAMLFTPKQLIREAHEILEQVGIAEKMYQRTDRLSGGQRQRVAIARALFQRPIALLADEPISSVDPARAQDTLEVLAAVSRQHGITFCASLHNIELARRYFPRIVGLRRGRITVDCCSSELSADCLSALYQLDRDEMTQDGS